MSRPARQLANLVQKIALKQSRTTGKPAKAGKRLKRWKKWAEHYKAASEGTTAAS